MHLVKNLNINKFGPSLILFAVPCKFVSAFKIFKNSGSSNLNSLPSSKTCFLLTKETDCLRMI